MDAMAEIRQTFFEECAEQLDALEAALPVIERGAPDAETIGTAYRAVHSVKGGAAAFKLDDLSNFARILESLLGELRAGRAEATPDFAALVRSGAAALGRLVALSRETSALLDTIKARVAQTKGEPEPEAPAAAADEGAASGFDFTPVAVDFGDLFGGAGRAGRLRARFRPHASLYASANEAARLIRDAVALGPATVRCDAGGLPLLSDLDPEGAYLAWTVEFEAGADEAALREVFEFAADDCDLQIDYLAEQEEGEVAEVAADLFDLSADPEMAALFARMRETSPELAAVA